MTSSRLKEADSSDNKMAMMAIDLSNSTYLSDNIQLQNVLQIDRGELHAKSHGLSIAQLRAQNREKGKWMATYQLLRCQLIILHHLMMIFI